MRNPVVVSRGFGIALLLIVVIFLVLLLVPGIVLIGVRLIVGWVLFLARVLPQIQWNWELMMGGVLALMLASVLLHRFLLWFVSAGASKRDWNVRSTVAIVVGILVLFVAATGMTGMVHQFAWLMREPILRNEFASVDRLNRMRG